MRKIGNTMVFISTYQSSRALVDSTVVSTAGMLCVYILTGSKYNRCARERCVYEGRDGRLRDVQQRRRGWRRPRASGGAKPSSERRWRWRKNALAVEPVVVAAAPSPPVGRRRCTAGERECGGRGRKKTQRGLYMCIRHRDRRRLRLRARACVSGDSVRAIQTRSCSA